MMTHARADAFRLGVVALVAFTIVRNAPGAWHLTGRSSAHLFSNHPERI